MAQKHTVKSGESLSSIALKHGFRNWKTIYDAPENEEFRKKRPDPHLIKVGDVVMIPERLPAKGTVQSGTPAVFKQLEPEPQPAVIEVGFFDANDTTAVVGNLTLSFSVSGNDEILVRTTGADGVLRMSDAPLKPGATLDILDIRETTQDPPIIYKEFAKQGLAVNQSHVIMLPDKRKIIDRIMAAHGIQRRSAWGARPAILSKIEQDWDFNMIVIHHSGNRGRKDPKALQDFHMDEEGFDDIAYQFVVRPDGTISEGRYLSHKGAANAKINTGKIGILVAGDFQPGILDFDDDEPTSAQLATVPGLIKTLRKEFPAITKVAGHRDLKDTECPGDDLYKHIPSFRAATGLGGP